MDKKDSATRAFAKANDHKTIKLAVERNCMTEIVFYAAGHYADPYNESDKRGRVCHIKTFLL